MAKRNFREMLEAKWNGNQFVCVGLDSDFSKISEQVKQELIAGGAISESAEDIMYFFNLSIVDATHDLVCAYKLNIAFYEAQGPAGIRALMRTTAYIREKAPDVPIILDAKRADIGNTNIGYVKAAFNIYGVDAITVHPYLGREALQPFLDQKDKGIIVLVRTSNPGAGEFQDLNIRAEELPKNVQAFCQNFRSLTGDFSALPIYQYVAYQVAKEWNKNGNCGIVVGATYPEELKQVREIVGDMPILIPGIGKQGGDVEKTVTAGKDSRGEGMIINSSRGIIFASQEADFAEVARQKTLELHHEIESYI